MQLSNLIINLLNYILEQYRNCRGKERGGGMNIKGDAVMDNEERYRLFCGAIEELDKGVALINEYDSLLHNYGGEIMFQAESHMIKAIGNWPGVTASQLAKTFNKSNSACSQLINKMKKKRWVQQERNEENSREYNLTLTEEGRKIYEKHHEFEEACYMRAYMMLDDVTPEELKAYIGIQKRLNRAFWMDVEESRSL